MTPEYKRRVWDCTWKTWLGKPTRLDAAGVFYPPVTYPPSRLERDDMEGLQGTVCAICRLDVSATPHRRRQVDHCHTSGFVRQFLCDSCNRGLGNFRDNPMSLLRAASYIEKHCFDHIDMHR